VDIDIMKFTIELFPNDGITEVAIKTAIYSAVCVLSDSVTISSGSNIMVDEETAPIIDQFGNQRWRNKDGRLHRENELPAVINKDGTHRWYKNGQCHRENDLPAIIWNDGHKEWWINGEFIRRERPDE